MKGYAALVRAHVDEELDGWRAGEPVRVHDRARRLTLDVIQSAMLGLRDDDLAARLAKILDTMASPAVNLGLFVPALQRGARDGIRRCASASTR